MFCSAINGNLLSSASLAVRLPPAGLQSSEDDGRVAGDVRAVVGQVYAVVLWRK